MPESPQNEDEAETLHVIRTHLTVAMLAVRRLHATHPDAEPVAHLFTHLYAAHQQLLRDIEQIEETLSELRHTRSRRAT